MSIDLAFRLTRHDFVLDVALTLPSRGVSAIFGPSGSGKTTLLRCVAGLERPEHGRLYVNGDPWHDDTHCLPVHRRPIGMVFQEASLFPHLSVMDNMRYGWQRTPAGQRHIRQEDVTELLGIGHLHKRYPAQLSGGERQRVALARALLTSPRLLLMDEPLSALDHERKQEILPYLERLHDELEIPVLYVSHAADEVARLADHLVLMARGQVIACGPLGEISARIDLPMAQRDDAGVVIEATIDAHDVHYHLTRLTFDGGEVHVARRDAAPGHRVRFRVFARDVSLAAERVEQTSITNLLPVEVIALAAADTPAHMLVQVRASNTLLIARITRRSADQLGVIAGRRMWAQIKAVALLGD